MWLARHKNVTFRSTSTYASGLHGVAIWFSILAGKSLKGAAFQAVEERRTISTPSSTTIMKHRDLSPRPSPKSIKKTTVH
jgi:hypothetical protein